MNNYDNYSLICMASSKIFNLFGKIKAKDIKPKDVDAVYTRPRSKIIATDNLDTNIINKINKINGINSYFNETDFISNPIPQKSTIFIGDNWYIILNNGIIIDSCVLDFDEKAIIEYKVTKKEIEERYLNNNHEASLSQEIDNNTSYTKVKSINKKL